MSIQFAYRPYRRSFRQPLSTRYGQWQKREGIIMRLSDESGRVGWGEIAPVPWFGSESLEQALEFCRHLPPDLDCRAIATIPDTLPACQFAFESAWEEGGWPIEAVLPPSPNFGRRVGDKDECRIDSLPLPLVHSVLLPAGDAVLESWQEFWQRGDRTFKWKIGVVPLDEELALFQRLMADFPLDARLRLDANGGLSVSAAQRWLAACESFPVEYLEQPLPPDQFDPLLALSTQFSTPLALDESVATLEQLKTCHERGWRGIYVIKPAIAGFPSHLRQFCQTHAIDAVFSSVFETKVGRRAGLSLAAELGNRDRAMGYGVDHWLEAPQQHDLEDISVATDLSPNPSPIRRGVPQAG